MLLHQGRRSRKRHVTKALRDWCSTGALFLLLPRRAIVVDILDSHTCRKSIQTTRMSKALLLILKRLWHHNLTTLWASKFFVLALKAAHCYRPEHLGKPIVPWTISQDARFSSEYSSKTAHQAQEKPSDFRCEELKTVDIQCHRISWQFWTPFLSTSICAVHFWVQL
jgi:hypothetical protein